MMNESLIIAPQETPRTAKRVRLPGPKKQLLMTLQRMEKLAQSGMLKETKLADILIEMGQLQKLLLQIDLDEKQDSVGRENESLKAQIEALKSKSNTTVDEEMKGMMEWRYTSTIKSLETQVEALKQQNLTLRQQNSQLEPQNIELKAANSELESRTKQLQNEKSVLQQESLTLQEDLARLRSRTPTELIAEVKAKLGG